MKEHLYNTQHFEYINSIVIIFGFNGLNDFETIVKMTCDNNKNNYICKNINEKMNIFKKLFDLKTFDLSRIKYTITTSAQAFQFLKKILDVVNIPYRTFRQNQKPCIRLIPPNNLYLEYINKMSEIGHKQNIEELSNEIDGKDLYNTYNKSENTYQFIWENKFSFNNINRFNYIRSIKSDEDFELFCNNILIYKGKHLYDDNFLLILDLLRYCNLELVFKNKETKFELIGGEINLPKKVFRQNVKVTLDNNVYVFAEGYISKINNLPVKECIDIDDLTKYNTTLLGNDITEYYSDILFNSSRSIDIFRICGSLPKDESSIFIYNYEREPSCSFREINDDYYEVFYKIEGFTHDTVYSYNFLQNVDYEICCADITTKLEKGVLILSNDTEGYIDFMNRKYLNFSIKVPKEEYSNWKNIKLIIKCGIFSLDIRSKVMLQCNKRFL